MYMFTNKLGHKGAASLLTVIVLAIVLALITTGLLRLSIQDQRSAIDDDLSNRAFFAAESGINDGLVGLERVVRDGSISSGELDALEVDNCRVHHAGGPADPILSPDGTNLDELNISVVCQLIDPTPDILESRLSEDENVQFELNPDSAGALPNGLVIRWHLIGSIEGADGSTISTPTTDTDFPPKNNWISNAPPIIRINLFSTPRSGTFTSNDFVSRNHVGFLFPLDNAGGSNVSLLGLDNGLIRSECSITGGTGPDGLPWTSG